MPLAPYPKTDARQAIAMRSLLAAARTGHRVPGILAAAMPIG
jgi:hypothetical protein